jgi:hypothetical protein
MAGGITYHNILGRFRRELAQRARITEKEKLRTIDAFIISKPSMPRRWLKDLGLREMAGRLRFLSVKPLSAPREFPKKPQQQMKRSDRRHFLVTYLQN